MPMPGPERASCDRWPAHGCVGWSLLLLLLLVFVPRCAGLSASIGIGSESDQSCSWPAEMSCGATITAAECPAQPVQLSVDASVTFAVMTVITFPANAGLSVVSDDGACPGPTYAAGNPAASISIDFGSGVGQCTYTVSQSPSFSQPNNAVITVVMYNTTRTNTDGAMRLQMDAQLVCCWLTTVNDVATGEGSVDDVGISFIQQWEAYSAYFYYDNHKKAGVADPFVTIGFGYNCHAHQCTGDMFSDGLITQADADQLFDNSLSKLGDQLVSILSAPSYAGLAFTQNQLDVVVDLAYAFGTSATKTTKSGQAVSSPMGGFYQFLQGQAQLQLANPGTRIPFDEFNAAVAAMPHAGRGPTARNDARQTLASSCSSTTVFPPALALSGLPCSVRQGSGSQAVTQAGICLDTRCYPATTPSGGQYWAWSSKVKGCGKGQYIQCLTGVDEPGALNICS